MAFEPFMIGDAIQNEPADDPTKAVLPIRIPYYRGIVLSLIEEFELTIDGDRFARDDIRFRLRGRDYSMDEVESDGHTRWEFGEWAALVVPCDGGLPAGEHDVELVQQLRLSYLPWPMRAEAMKKVTVEAR